MKQMQKITQDELKRSERVSQDIEDSASRFKLLFMAALAGTFLFSGWIAFYLSRNIAGTVRRITRVANDLAARNFTETQIKVTSRDELGEVAAAFTEMTGYPVPLISVRPRLRKERQNRRSWPMKVSSTIMILLPNCSS